VRSRVLIVDDEAPQRLAFKRLLTMRSIPTFDVASGNEAIAFVESELPTVIVLDEMMPDMCGRDTLAKLRQIPGASKIPVYFYSAAPSPTPTEIRDLDLVGWFMKASTPVQTILTRIEITHRDEQTRQDNP
jgi:CheY-like chemotaxis protein